MAITASIALDQATIAYNQQSHANVTISNSGLSDVTLTFMQPHIRPNNSNATENNINSQFSGPTFNSFSAPFVSPASGSVVVPFSFVVFSPQVIKNGNLSQSIPTTYKVGCLIQTSDGSQAATSESTLTITPITPQ